AAIAVANIIGGAPQVSSDFLPPFPYGIDTVLANAVDNRPASLDESVSHLCIGFAHHRRRLFGILLGIVESDDWAKAAQVILQEIDTPRVIGLRILFLMAITALVARTRLGSGRGIDSELEPLRVHIICECFHV